MVYGPAYGDGFVANANPSNIAYIKGDENTDGSLRLLPDTSFGTEVEFQVRQSGVWNDTGILIAASTVYLGRELQMSGGGEYVLTKDLSADIRSLIPHVRFDQVTGTEEIVVVPKVSALASDVILQSDDTGEISGTTIQWAALSTDLLLANTLLLKTGSTAATGDVTVKLFRTSFTEDLFYQRTYPQATFTASSNISLTTDGLVELFANATFYVVLECTGTLTLKADATNTTPYYGGNFYSLTEDTITPDEFGGAMSRMVTFRSKGVLATWQSNGGPTLWQSSRNAA